MRSQASSPVERYADYKTHCLHEIGWANESTQNIHMTFSTSLKILCEIFPYEFEIPAGPSMYPGSGGNSQTGPPPVVQFVGFLGRIRFTPQDEKVLPMDDI